MPYLHISAGNKDKALAEFEITARLHFKKEVHQTARQTMVMNAVENDIYNLLQTYFSEDEISECQTLSNHEYNSQRDNY